MLFVLDAPLARYKAWPHVDLENRSIEWDDILATCFALSEELMVRAAMAMWSRDLPCSLGELQFALDDHNITQVFAGILLSRRLIDLAGARYLMSEFTRRKSGMPDGSR